jgi:hypothetical protein
LLKAAVFGNVSETTALDIQSQFPTEPVSGLRLRDRKAVSFVAGVCQDGYYLVEDGQCAGNNFNSANDAVNTVREPSSNAFLYIHFYLAGGRWIIADDLRSSGGSQLDPAEERAIEDALSAIRMHPKGKSLGRVEATRKAANLVKRRPQMIEEARRQLSWIAGVASVDPADLGL